MAGTGDVVHCRQRGGNTNSGRGAGSFLTETFNRLRSAGAGGPITLRADSGFYSGAVAAACRSAGVRYSITVRLNKALHKVIAAIPDDAWAPIPYFLDGADVAETTYRPFGKKAPLVRLIVRRVKPTPGSQLALLVDWSFHAFVTDRACPGIILDCLLCSSKSDGLRFEVALTLEAVVVTHTHTSQTRVLRYLDPVEGFRGFVAFAGSRHSLAAGGLRVQPGFDETTVVRLAEAMKLKERLLGLAVDGAKAGIDYDPHSPGKEGALRRFLAFLRPHLLERLSLGSDMGTTWTEIEKAARAVGVPSVKGAVARAQGLNEEDFCARIHLLDTEIDGATLGERRAGHALAHAALAAIDAAGLTRRKVRVGIQGFGTLGRAAAMALTEAGLTPTAVTDEHTCLHCYDDVVAPGDVESPASGEAQAVTVAEVGAPESLSDLPLDVLVLAACGDAISLVQAARLEVAAVVVGANLGLQAAVEELLHRRGILVVPDFVGGCGGSASMDALFGPASRPTAMQVLDQTGDRMRALVGTIMEMAKARGITPRQAALAVSQLDAPLGRPYGRWQESRS